MSNKGFRGLPDHVQKIVLQGLEAEVRAAKEKIREAEQARPIDDALLRSLRGDVSHAESLYSRLEGGQA